MSGPTLEEIGRLAVRLVRAVEAISEVAPGDGFDASMKVAADEAERAWEDLKTLVEQYGDKVDPAGGG
jgi:hypothetical protein